MDFAFVFSGFAVGLIIGLTGVGGGSLMTPLLVLGFGIAPAIAVGTDLLYAAITKAGGIWVHQRRGNIDWGIVGLLAIGSLPSSLLMIRVLDYLNSRGVDYEPLITSTLGVALILTSLVLLLKARLLALSEHENFTAVRAAHRRLQKPMTIAAGAIIGALVALSSVGAGALGAASLFFLYPRLRTISIVGTDLAHAVPLTAIAGLGHVHLGTVDFVLLGSLLIGSLPGIYLGGYLGTHVPDRIMRAALASLLLLIGLRFAL